MTDVRIQVEGLKEFNKSLNGVQKGLAKEMSKIHKKVAEPVADDARRRVRSRSGRLAKTVRPLGSQRAARVAAGRKGLDRATGYDYSRINHFGGYPGNYQGNPFLIDALHSKREEALDLYHSLTDQFIDSVWESYAA